MTTHPADYIPDGPTTIRPHPGLPELTITPEQLNWFAAELAATTTHNPDTGCWTLNNPDNNAVTIPAPTTRYPRATVYIPILRVVYELTVAPLSYQHALIRTCNTNGCVAPQHHQRTNAQ